MMVKSAQKKTFCHTQPSAIMQGFKPLGKNGLFLCKLLSDFLY